jgi:ribosomal protein S27E
MKNAKVTVAAVNVQCPYCSELICEQTSGSQLWEIGDSRLTSGRIIVCDSCGEEVKIPASVKSEKI